jgi:hyperosmotically inducible protein
MIPGWDKKQRTAVASCAPSGEPLFTSPGERRVPALSHRVTSLEVQPSCVVRADGTIVGRFAGTQLGHSASVNCKILLSNVLQLFVVCWHSKSSEGWVPTPHLMKTSKTAVFALLIVSPLALLADSATDRKIEDAAASSYNFRTVLEKQVEVKAEDGVVTMTGTVLDRDQKALAEDTVRGLPGVTGVNNKLEVASPGPVRSDGWIALKIRSVLLLRSNVSATTTDVSVRNGVVALTGTADNLAQKELTGEYARDVEGVKSVKNDIVVHEPGVGVVAATDRTMGEKIDDGSITAQVKYALLTHRSTSALKTNVETKNGVVSIRGNAGSDAEKDLVSKLARSVRGVTSVENGMTVHVAE